MGIFLGSGRTWAGQPGTHGATCLWLCPGAMALGLPALRLGWCVLAAPASGTLCAFPLPASCHSYDSVFGPVSVFWRKCLVAFFLILLQKFLGVFVLKFSIGYFIQALSAEGTGGFA